MSELNQLLSLLRHQGRSRGVRLRRTVVAATVALSGGLMLLAVPVAAAAVAEAYPQWQRENAMAQLHPLGAEVRDGPVTFVVHRARCAHDAAQTRHGRLCEVTIGVRNDGADEMTIPASAQKLAGPDGARHLPTVEEEQDPFGTLAPGENASATLAFDIPPHARITSVRVFADAHSAGQGVALQRKVAPSE